MAVSADRRAAASFGDSPRYALGESLFIARLAAGSEAVYPPPKWRASDMMSLTYCCVSAYMPFWRTELRPW